MSLTIDGITYTQFPLGDRNLFFRNYVNSQTRNFYYIAPSSEPVLLGKYSDNATILKNGNDRLTGEMPDDNKTFIETYMFRNGQVARQVARSNPYLYYTTTTSGGRRRRTNRKKSKRRKTKRRKSTRRR